MYYGIRPLPDITVGWQRGSGCLVNLCLDVADLFIDDIHLEAGHTGLLHRSVQSINVLISPSGSKGRTDGRECHSDWLVQTGDGSGLVSYQWTDFG